MKSYYCIRNCLLSSYVAVIKQWCLLDALVWDQILILIQQRNFPASWSSGNAFVSGAGGLRFKSRAGQIGHSVANGSPPLRHFERSCAARPQRRGDGPRKLVTSFGVIQQV